MFLLLSVSVCDPNAALGFCVAEANHESLFCVDELDSLFSYFNTSAKPCCRKYSYVCVSRRPASLSALSEIHNVTIALLSFHECEFQLNSIQGYESRLNVK